MQNALSASFTPTRLPAALRLAQAGRLIFLLTAVSSIALSANSAYSSGPFSADGRYFVFDTDRALLPGDTNGMTDVYRLDRQTDGLTLVSVNQNNTGAGNSSSHSPVISADGNVVAFSSFASNLAAPDSSGNPDVFVRDLTTSVTTLISVNHAGTGSGSGGGSGSSFGPQLSADGRFVAFSSEATNLVAIPDQNGDDDEFIGSDVFVRNRVTGVTKLVSVNQAGSASGGRPSSLDAISADGRVVVFESLASDLVPQQPGNDVELPDVYARELASGVTSLVSVNTTGTRSGNAPSFDSAVSADGTIVTFTSGASDLTANDTNGHSDIFVRNLALGTTELVSLASGGAGSGNEGSFGAQISADGRIVAFRSFASDLVPGDNNSTEDIFVRDLTTGVTTLATINRSGTGSANSASGLFALSANGKIVGFESLASDLTANPVDGEINLFVRDLPAGVTRLASANSSGSGIGSEETFFPGPTLSGDGSVLAFVSSAVGLVADDVFGTGLYLFSVNEPAGGRFLETDGLVVIEAEHFHGSTTASGHAWEARTDRAGFVGESAMRALPNTGANLTANIATSSPVLSYQVEFTTAGTYNFWVRGFGANGSDDSVHVGVDGQVAQALPYSRTGVWMWRAKQVVISSPGLHEVSVWMREDGTYVDRILLAANLSFTPTGNGPAESGRVRANSSPDLISWFPPDEDWPPDQVATVAVGESLPMGVTLEGGDSGLFTFVWVSDLRPIETQMVSGGGEGNRTRSFISYTPTTDDIGTRTIRVTISDPGGPSFTHTFMPVIVTGPNQPPSVQITAPASGSSYSAGTPISVTANATDSDGAIASVAFYANATLLVTDTTAPFATDWNPAQGNYQLTAVATDNQSATATSAPVNVTITAPAGPGAFLESGGLVVIEAEHFESTTTASGHAWVPRTDRAGFVGESALQATPNNGANLTANVAASSPGLNYQVEFTTTGTYNFWIRGFGANGSDDSVHVGVDGQVLQTLPYSRTGAWMWRAKQIVVSSPGLHVVNVWMREDGTYVDRVLLSANLSFVPTGDGPPESERSAPHEGEPPPNDPADLTVWPNQTSHANSDQWLADNHDNLRRMNPRVLVLNFSNLRTREQLDGQIQNIIAAMSESSRYHGYEDPNAQAFLNFQVFKFVDLRDASPTQANSTKVPLKPPPADFNIDYKQFFDGRFAQYYGVRASENPPHFLRLAELIDRGYVHDVWFFLEHIEGYGPFESVELKARYNEQFQRVGNEFVDAGNGSDPEQPWTGRTVRIAFINPDRGIGCFVHNLGHAVESESSAQAIPYFTRYFAEFGGFDLNTRFGLPFPSFYSLPDVDPNETADAIAYPDPGTAFVTNGTEVLRIDNYVAYGGNCHFPPNARGHYDYQNAQPVMSTIEDWRIGSGTGGADLAIPWTNGALSPFSGYDDDCGGRWLIYWRQNFPGLDNLQADDNGAPMKNWWPFLFY